MCNRITIELSQQDRERLDKLVEALAKGNCINCTQEEKVQEETVSIPENVPAAPTSTVDRADLRAKVIELSAKGLKEQTRDIVRQYGQTVTNVPEDKVAECYGKLKALDN